MGRFLSVGRAGLRWVTYELLWIAFGSFMSCSGSLWVALGSFLGHMWRLCQRFGSLGGILMPLGSLGLVGGIMATWVACATFFTCDMVTLGS